MINEATLVVYNRYGIHYTSEITHSCSCPRRIAEKIHPVALKIQTWQGHLANSIVINRVLFHKKHVDECWSLALFPFGSIAVSLLNSFGGTRVSGVVVWDILEIRGGRDWVIRESQEIVLFKKTTTYNYAGASHFCVTLCNRSGAHCHGRGLSRIVRDAIPIGGEGKLVYAESELHTLDGAADVLVNLAVALLFGGPLAWSCLWNGFFLVGCSSCWNVWE